MQTIDPDKQAEVSVVHVFDAPAKSYVSRALARSEDIKDYLAREETRAAGALAEFVGGMELAPVRQVVKLNEMYIVHAICATAGEVSADLIVVGTRGRAGMSKFLLGSVAQEVLHIADHDVLAIPSGRA